MTRGAVATLTVMFTHCAGIAISALSASDAGAWHGPIDVTYSDTDCPNVGCHGPWKGVTGPEVCELICDRMTGCNAMNFNGGGCCLRACALGKQITANKTTGNGLSYYRVGPAPPAPPPCSAIKDKLHCLEPFCVWNSSHCEGPPLPPPLPPPPPRCASANTSAECIAPGCVWNQWNLACCPAPPPPRPVPPPIKACSGCTDNLATNYNASAVVDSGTCQYDCARLIQAVGAANGTNCYVYSATGIVSAPVKLQNVGTWNKDLGKMEWKSDKFRDEHIYHTDYNISDPN